MIYRQTAVTAKTFYAVSLLFIKISILCLYGRIFSGLWLNRTLWALGTLIACYSIPLIFGTLFQCIPLRSLWDDSITDAKCIDFSAVVITYGTFNVTTNFIILVLPALALWKEQGFSDRKRSLFFIFLIGGL